MIFTTRKIAFLLSAIVLCNIGVEGKSGIGSIFGIGYGYSSANSVMSTAQAYRITPQNVFFGLYGFQLQNQSSFKGRISYNRTTQDYFFGNYGYLKQIQNYFSATFDAQLRIVEFTNKIYLFSSLLLGAETRIYKYSKNYAFVGHQPADYAPLLATGLGLAILATKKKVFRIQANFSPITLLFNGTAENFNTPFQLAIQYEFLPK